MKANITIDARWLEGGIGTYTRQLLQGLGTHAKDFKVCAITHQVYAEAVAHWGPQVTVVNTPIYTAREQWTIVRAARGCDLLHVPHYNAPLLQRTPLVVTIHDLIHLTDPDYRRSLKGWVYARPILNLVARKAKHIVTDSEYSRMQIMERLDVYPSKVSTIHCGVNGEFLPMDKEKAFAWVSSALKIREPYLLYVGTLKRHKNVSTLLKAFARLRRQGDLPQRLLIVGHERKGRGELARECARLGIKGRVDFVAHVSQELLPKVYAAADLLVMPSRIEGFGLPVLEAMACGTPVVSSRATSLTEVGGEAVMYFDPHSPDDLARAIERVLNSSELREALRIKGLSRAARFSWKEAVEKHVEVYRSVLS